MIAEEVNRYKHEMLDYFHARQVDVSQSESFSSYSHQYYTTSLTHTTYELDGYNTTNEFTSPQQVNSSNDDDGENRVSSTMKSSSENHSRLKSISYDQEQSQMRAFLTDDPPMIIETNAIPFHDAFRIPSNLVNTLMLTYVYLN